MPSPQPLPDLFETRRTLRPILPAIYRSVEGGVQEAVLYFRMARHEYEGGLHAAIVRANARHTLTELGFTLDDLPSNGICLHYHDYRIKILKARDDRLPETNQSDSRLRFFRQEILLAGSEFLPRAWNLLVLWDIDNTLELTGLRVACTKPIDGDPEGYEAYWEFVIDDPTETIVPPPSPIESRDMDDVGYSLPEWREHDEETGN